MKEGIGPILGNPPILYFPLKQSEKPYYSGLL
jgi:hypothetical protein